ncbi:MAG: Rieske 2Fe-2S domain-containing protein [Thermoguttaceae bacterium]
MKDHLCCCHEESPSGDRNARRGFLGQAIALLCGATAFLIPTAVGVATFLNPLRQKGQGGRWMRLATLDTLPTDGTPQRVPVIADRTDAWTRYPAEPVGAVFLRRSGEKVAALQVVCPHAGCTIDYQSSPKGGAFLCPCHTATFDLQGKRTQTTSPCPRDMDRLEVEVRNNVEVWVKFESFLLGVASKVPQA